MPENTLLILSSNAETYKQYLEAHDFKNLTCYACSTIEEAQSYLLDANIMLADPALAKQVLAKEVSNQMSNQMPQLVWLQSTWAGVNALIEDDLRQDYVLTGVKGIFGELMSEYVFGYILLLERNILAHQTDQSKRSWRQIQPGRLKDKTIGIMGTGSIGQHIAGTAKHFGMQVLGLSNSGELKENFKTCFAVNKLHDFLVECDYVVSTLPDTSATTNLLNKASFNTMKPSAWLISIGRGPVIDEVALLEATQSKDIAGAVLDVFVEEPLASDSPLWEQDNIFITPHVSAPSFPEDVAEIFVDNYRRFVNKEELKFCIDFEKGY